MKLNGNLKFLSLGASELQNAIIERLASDPATTEDGRIYYNTTDGEYRFYKGVGSPQGWMPFGEGQLAERLRVAGGNVYDSNGDYNAAAMNALSNVSGSTNLFEAISDIDAAITAGSETYRILDADADTIVETEQTAGGDQDTVRVRLNASTTDDVVVQADASTVKLDSLGTVDVDSAAGSGITLDTANHTAATGGIAATTGTSSAGAGGNIGLVAGGGATTGGDIELTAGFGTSNDGGKVQLSAGSSDTTTGGALSLSAGSGDDNNAAGGVVGITSGGGYGSADGGNITITSGDGGATGSAGIITLQGGSGVGTTDPALGGDIHLYGGYASSGSEGGDILILAGNSASGYSLGDVEIKSGEPAAGNVSAASLNLRGAGAAALEAAGWTGANGTGGNAGVQAGFGRGAAYSGGDVYVRGGDGDASADGGTVYLTPGRGDPTGSPAATSGEVVLVEDGSLANNWVANSDKVTLRVGTSTTDSADGLDLEIKAGAPYATAGEGGSVSILGTDGIAGDTGGAINFTAGDGGASSGYGGHVNITGGAAPTTGIAYGGTVNIDGGTGSYGGNVLITGGTPDTYAGGRVGMYGGVGGGVARLYGGGANATNAVAGPVTVKAGGGGALASGAKASIIGGSSSLAAGNGGDVDILGGDGGSAGTGGDISVKPGVGSAGASNGNVNLLGPNTTLATELRIFENNSDASQYIGLTVADNAVTGAITYTLPEAPAGNDYLMRSSTAGVMSWVDPTTVGRTRLEDLDDVTADTTGSPQNAANSFLVANGAGSYVANTAAQSRTALGLVSGGAGDIWVEKAGDTMTGDLTMSSTSQIFLDNSVDSSNPDLTWTADPDTGWNLAADGFMGGVVAGAIVFQLRASYIQSTIPHRFGNGSAASPSITFLSDTDKGIFSAGTDLLGFSAGGSERLRIHGADQDIIGSPATETTEGVLEVRTANYETLIGDWDDLQGTDDFLPNAAWVSLQLNEFLPLAGGTMTGNIDMGTTNNIINLAAPSDALDATNKAYVDALGGGLTWINPVYYIDFLRDDIESGNTGTTVIKDLVTPANDTAGVEDTEHSDMMICAGDNITFRVVRAVGSPLTVDLTGIDPGHVVRLNLDPDNGGAGAEWEDIGHISIFDDETVGIHSASVRWGTTIDTNATVEGTFAGFDDAIFDLVVTDEDGGAETDEYDSLWGICPVCGTSHVQDLTVPAAASFTGGSVTGDYFELYVAVGNRENSSVIADSGYGYFVDPDNTDATRGTGSPETRNGGTLLRVWYQRSGTNTPPANAVAPNDHFDTIVVDITTATTANDVRDATVTALNNYRVDTNSDPTFALASTNGSGIVRITDQHIGLVKDMDATTNMPGGSSRADVTDGSFDGPAEGTAFLVSNSGSLNFGKQFVYTGTFGVDGQWVEFGATTPVAAGAGLSYTGNTLNVNFGAGIQETPDDQVGIDIRDPANGALILTTDGTSREADNASAELYLLLDGVTLTQSSLGLKVDTITNSELTDSDITFSGDLGADQTIALGDTLEVNGGTGVTVTAGTVGSPGGVSSLTIDVTGTVWSLFDGTNTETIEHGDTVTVTGGIVSATDTVKIRSIADADGDTSIETSTGVADDGDFIRMDVGDTPVGYPAVTDIMTLASSGWTVAMGTANVSGTVGAPISLTSGTGNTSGQGGLLSLNGGDGGVTGVGGSVVGRAGDGGATSGNGGDMSLYAGNAIGSSSSGGTARLQSGDSVGSTTGGTVVIESGAGGPSAGAGGAISISTAVGSTTGAGGAITVITGDGGPTSGTGGTLTLGTGAGGLSTGDGGNLVLTTGNGGVVGSPLTGGSAGDFTLTTGDSYGTDNDGGDVTVTTGTGSSTSGSNDAGEGGRIVIQTGDGGDAADSGRSGGGGDIHIFAGDEGTTSTGFHGEGGDIRIWAGDGTDDDSQGQISIRAGLSPVWTTHSQFAANGGSTSVLGAAAAAGNNGGQVLLQTLGGDNGGRISLQTGNGTVNAGHINLELGTGSTGDNGWIDFQAITSSGTQTWVPEFRFLEASVNGTNYVGLKAPLSVGGSPADNIVYSLPVAPVSDGDVLSSTIGGVMSWIPASTFGVSRVEDLNDVTASTSGSPIDETGNILVKGSGSPEQYASQAIQFNYDSLLHGSPTASTSHTVTHNLGQQFVNVTVYEQVGSPVTYEQVIPKSVTLTSANELVVTFNNPINCVVVVMGVPGVPLA